MKRILVISAAIIIIGTTLFYEKWRAGTPMIESAGMRNSAHDVGSGKVNHESMYAIEQSSTFPQNPHVDSLIRGKHGRARVFAFIPQTQEWYIVTDTGGRTSLFRDQIIEKINADGKGIKVTTIKSLPIDIVQVSPDGRSIGFIVETPAEGNTAEYYQQKMSETNSEVKNEYLDLNSKPGAVYLPQMTSVLIQTSSGTVFTFVMPGDAREYWNSHTEKSQLTSEGWIKNIMGSWLFVDDQHIEFTRFYAATAEKNSQGDIVRHEQPIQTSDKELWSYDIPTGKLTLLETIPFVAAE